MEVFIQFGDRLLLVVNRLCDPPLLDKLIGMETRLLKFLDPCQRQRRHIIAVNKR